MYHYGLIQWDPGGILVSDKRGTAGGCASDVDARVCTIEDNYVDQYDIDKAIGDATPEILRMFVEKIIVHDSVWTNRHRTQQIDIHYNFVGELDFSVGTVQTCRRNYKNLPGDNSSVQQTI